MTTSTSLSYLTSASSDADFLARLKDLKNAVIGNVWKKVELAENDEVIQFLLGLLAIPTDADAGTLDTRLEIIQETTVIIGALANIGPLTLGPLLSANVPARLCCLVAYLSSTPSGDSGAAGGATGTRERVLSSILRALRNVLVSTADELWGHMWGVGAERKVVGTGLEDVVLRAQSGASSSSAFPSRAESLGGWGAGAVKGKEVAVPADPPPGSFAPLNDWIADGEAALRLIFDDDHLPTLLHLLSSSSNPQILLPLFQLFGRLVALPSHREALIRWFPSPSSSSPSTALSFASGASGASPTTPYILDTILLYISSSYSSAVGPSVLGRRPNPKILESVLDLLAALVRGSPAVAGMVRKWSDPRLSTGVGAEAALEASFTSASDVSMDGVTEAPRIEGMLGALMEKGGLGVQISAASCLTNILKADESSRRKHNILLHKDTLLGVIGKVLKGEALEEKIRICFALAALASDDEDIQRSASSFACPARLIEMLRSVDEEEANGDLGEDPSSRAKEAIILALASLSGSYEPTRAYLAELKPPFLPHLKAALGHPSYGVRAASCQLARALSRTVAILRTSLVDSGVGEEVILVLKREHDARAPGRQGGSGERAYTVEVAATAAICNLITDFSPLKSTLINDGGIELLCELAGSPHEPLALNALWAIKNLMFRETESLKNRVVGVLGVDTLKQLMSNDTAPPLRAQAFEITQNLLADAQSAELTRSVEMLGEWELLDLVIGGGRAEEIEVRVPALYVLSNLALGNERLRGALVARGDVLELLSSSLNSTSPQIITPALRTFRHLIESNVKTRKPRQAVVDLLHPYRLKDRLKGLVDSTSLDVSHTAIALLDVLERAKEPGPGSVGTTGTR